MSKLQARQKLQNMKYIYCINQLLGYCLEWKNINVHVYDRDQNYQLAKLKPKQQVGMIMQDRIVKMET